MKLAGGVGRDCLSVPYYVQVLGHYFGEVVIFYVVLDAVCDTKCAVVPAVAIVPAPMAIPIRTGPEIMNLGCLNRISSAVMFLAVMCMSKSGDTRIGPI